MRYEKTGDGWTLHIRGMLPGDDEVTFRGDSRLQCWTRAAELFTQKIDTYSGLMMRLTRSIPSDSDEDDRPEHVWARCLIQTLEFNVPGPRYMYQIAGDDDGCASTIQIEVAGQDYCKSFIWSLPGFGENRRLIESAIISRIRTFVASVAAKYTPLKGR